jgi:hypothetical protein
MIQNNLMIRSFENFLMALKGHDFASTAYQYSPGRLVGYFSFALNYYFGGVDVKGYHLVNLFIHIVNACLVYFLALLTFRTPYLEAIDDRQGAMGASPLASNLLPVAYSRLIAFFSALLFVSHPVQTQAVTYIVQRFTSLSTLFYLLSVVMYIKGRLWARGYGQAKEESREYAVNSMQSAYSVPPGAYRHLVARRLSPVAYYVLSLLFAVLAMRTKEIAYTLPLVIILYETVFFIAPLKKRLLFLLPVALILIVVAVSYIRWDRPLGEILSALEATTRAETKMPRWDYLMTEMRVITTYIRLIFLPINQTLDYDYPTYHSFFEPPVFMSFFFLSSIFWAAVWLLYNSRRGATPLTPPLARGKAKGGVSSIIAYRPTPIACYRLIAFGILWFFITLSVESSIIPIKDVIAEHRLYLPSVGFFIALAAGVVLLLKQGPRFTTQGPRSSGASRFTTHYSLIMKIAAGLFSVIILALSVATYSRNSIWKDRVIFWEDVVKKGPNLARSHTGLGAVYFRQDRLAEAMEEFQTAVSLNLSDFIAHYDMGLIYWRQGRLDEAKKEFQAAASLKPENAVIRSSLGKVYEQQGFLYDAISEYEAALKLDPGLADARRHLEVLNRKTRATIIKKGR